ncbi:NAD(P)/FAD-dependent oxidoreductase [Streptomyces sp. CA-181903]|uniref:NAD(P)/FAD-dependent oxidoreductase n=1 Tax=Streptomyces sp. CA-181903 TaxID=3240055 RepID=UPI003D91C8B0
MGDRREPPEETRDHAVVLGAGLAGLLAAAVLRRRFARVTVVDRDRLPREGPAYRPGVPQSRHLHTFWSTGMDAIAELLPGVMDDWLRAGGRVLEVPREVLWLGPADWFGPMPGVPALFAHREAIEWGIRHQVLRQEGITLLERHEVTGLLPAADGSVEGVRLRPRPAPDAPDARARTELRAGLVVDATGRTSKAPSWLTALGRPAPAVSRCDAHFAYASRIFRPAPEHHDAAPLYVQGRPGDSRAGACLPVGPDRWVVTLLGVGPEAPPVHDDGFLDHARRLRSPLLFERLRHAEFLTPTAGFRDTANTRVHYERMTDWPAGFLVVGDAACSLNPVYGHGITVAALGVRALADALTVRTATRLRAEAHTVQRAIARTARTAWAIATGEDMRHPGAEGPRPNRSGRLLQGYMRRLTAAAADDPRISRPLFQVMSLSAPPAVLLRPTTVLRVLSHSHAATSPPSTARLAPHRHADTS